MLARIVALWLAILQTAPALAAQLAPTRLGGGAPTLSVRLSGTPAPPLLGGGAPNALSLVSPSLSVSPVLSVVPAIVPTVIPSASPLVSPTAVAPTAPVDEPGALGSLSNGGPFMSGADSGSDLRLNALFDASVQKPGATRQGDVVDDYFGTEVADPYRWLEEDTQETRAWVKEQNRYSSALLSQLPGREQIKERLKQLYSYSRTGMPQRKGKNWIFSANSGTQNQAVLYKSKTLYGAPEVLLDPNALSADGTVALSATNFSRDGKLMAYAVSRSGSDWQEWKVRDVATGQDLPEVIRWAKNTNVSWNKAGTGFYYSRYAQPKPGEDLSGVNRDQKIYFHALGAPQEQDSLVYERPDQPNWGFSAGESEDGKSLFIYQWEGTEPKNRIFVKDLTKPGAEVKPLFGDFDAAYSIVHRQGDKVYVQTTKDAPRGRLIAVDLKHPARESWKDVIPQGKGVLESVSAVGKKVKRFVAVWSRDAHQSLEVYGPRGGFQRRMELPDIGSIENMTLTDRKGKGFFQFASYTQPRTVYRADFATGKTRAYKRPKTAFDPKKFESRQVFYPSKDGTMVPMFLVHKKGLKLDGKNPTYLYGYGGFNVSLTPAFSASELAWMELGGVYAVANLRGGGEYGQEWHDAGRRDNKQNVFDDFIAAAEYLIAEKVTSKEKLAIGGGSNGGLLVGAVMTQRPDLFAAAVPQVGVLDMLRFHLFTVGKGWRSDYGSSETKEGFATLMKYSPLHNVKAGTEYPATLVMTGDHDDRVVPAHSFKFTAALQAAQKGDAPIMARIESDAGHGAGKPMSKYIDEAADLWAFLMKALGMR